MFSLSSSSGLPLLLLSLKPPPGAPKPPPGPPKPNKTKQKQNKKQNSKVGGSRIYLNKPEVWQSSTPNSEGKIARCLIEPYINGEYIKFNSNTGFATESHRKMQALSHFSYQYSGGLQLLCDLQGGRYDDYWILTDPVICSTQRSFGPTDLGPSGIDNFFAHHECNKYCRGWSRPSCPQKCFRPVAGTTFAGKKLIFE